MPAEDPTREIDEVIDAYFEERLPEEAYLWAKAALERVDEMHSALRDLDDLGDPNTATLENGLEDIYKEAWQWLILSRG
jgi:two-component SAPR family response regulator